MLKMLVKLQRKHLELVVKFKDNEPKLVEAVALLESCDAGDEERLEAERYVHQVNNEYGEFCGHGDQLTVEVKFLSIEEVSKIVVIHFSLKSGISRCQGNLLPGGNCIWTA